MLSVHGRKQLKEFVGKIIGPESFNIDSRKSNPDSISNIIVISVPRVGIEVEIHQENFNLFEDSVVDDVHWREFIQKVEPAINEAIYSTLISDFKKIGEAYEYYSKHCSMEFTYPDNLKAKSIDENQLHDLCCDVFAYRIAFISKEIKKIMNFSYTDLIESELVLGILLRSIILDSILIMGWMYEPRFISEIASESFTKIPKLPKMNRESWDIIEKMKLFNQYFNAHKVDGKEFKATVDGVFEKLPDLPNFENYKVAYSYYSKYDHFSLIPFLITKTVAQKMLPMVLSTLLIKDAFCNMVAIHRQEHQAIFEKILGVKAEVTN